MSKKVKYYYDDENLAFRKVKPKKGKKIGYIALFIVSAALFGFLCFVLFMNIPFLETPKNKVQNREIENLKINYTILKRKLDNIDEVLAAIEDRDNNLYRVYFNSSPITEQKRREGFIDRNRYKELEGYNNSDLVVSTTKRVDEITKALAIQSKSLDEILKLAKEKDKLLNAIPAIQPVKNEDLKRMAVYQSTKNARRNGLYCQHRNSNICHRRRRCEKCRQLAIGLRKPYRNKPRFWICNAICTFKQIQCATWKTCKTWRCYRLCG